jgi:chromosome segregation ATPase
MAWQSSFSAHFLVTGGLQLEKAQQEAADLRARLQAADDRVADLTRERDSLRAAQGGEQHNLAAILEERDRLRTDLTKITAKHRSEKDTAQQELFAAKQSLTAAQAQIEKLSAQLEVHAAPWATVLAPEAPTWAGRAVV